MSDQNQALIDAIKDRIALGHAREDIEAEVTAAGYSDEEFAAAYTAAGGAPATPLPPLPKAPAQAPSPVSTDESKAAEESSVDTPPREPTAARHSTPVRTGVPVVGIVVGLLAALLLGGGVFANATGLLDEVLDSVGSLFSTEQPPFTADNFITGIGESITTIESASVSLSANATLASRDPDVVPPPALADEPALSLLEANMVPKELSFTMDFTGAFDLNDLTNPNSENTISMTLVTDDLDMAVNFDAKSVENEGIFGRLNDLDLDMFNMFLPDLEPIFGLWIQVEGAEALAEQAANRDIEADAVAELAELYPRALAIAEETGVLYLAAEPERFTYADGPAYRYQFSLDAAAIPEFVRALNAEVASVGLTPLTDRELQEVLDAYDAETVEWLNQFAPMSWVVRPDGTFVAFVQDLRFVADDRVFSDVQLLAQWSLTLSDHNEPITVTPPSEAITTEEAAARLGLDIPGLGASGLEVPSGGPLTARESAENASALQALSSMRSQAELYYNQNGFSYQGMCLDADISALRAATNRRTECVATDRTYRVYVPWTGEVNSVSGVVENFWCIDSNGNSRAYESIDPAADTCAEAAATQSGVTEADANEGRSWLEALMAQFAVANQVAAGAAARATATPQADAW